MLLSEYLELLRTRPPVEIDSPLMHPFYSGYLIGAFSRGSSYDEAIEQAIKICKYIESQDSRRHLMTMDAK